MKTTDPRDPLDRKIDALLASRPLKPSADFTTRVLAAADQLPNPSSLAETVHSISPIGRLLRFALPIAALIAVAFTLAVLMPTKPAADTQPAISSADIQEIFLLEESLSDLPHLEMENFNSTDLLSALDALYFEIES